MHRYVFMPVIRTVLDAENGHQLAVKVLRSGLGPKDPVKDDERLKTEVCLHWTPVICGPYSSNSSGESISPIRWAWQRASTKTARP